MDRQEKKDILRNIEKKGNMANRKITSKEIGKMANRKKEQQ